MTRYHAKFQDGEKVYEEIDGQVTIDRMSRGQDAGYYVMGDIQPYKSQLSGEVVTSRSRHRNLLREHGCIEVGNETKYLKAKPVKPPPGLKQRIIEIANEKLRS